MSSEITEIKVLNFIQIDDMVEQLASLLLPIDALLGQQNFNPREDSSQEVMTLFRNTWFLCILFGFTTENKAEATAMDWLQPALARIAIKTPSMVVEESHDAVASDVEYNSVIRQEYSNTVRCRFIRRRNPFSRHSFSNR